ncbi:MAG TPA: TIGR03560 family F420-dependent LLM class oxidoreductase [Actinomycetota bacterium]|nr:TIGR03560 family F420-dependent LLM class oxidoreductase [Actinomycetota bacterium]
MRIGIDVSQHQLTWESLLGRVLFAEQAGFDSAWVFDHFKPLYGDPTGPCLEGWTLLAGLGAATTSIRLGALVTGATYRHPSILATEAVTVDHITDGRLELGMGAAWFQQEHIELGVEFPGTGERVDRFEDAVQIAKLLMTEDRVSFQGHHFRLEGASYNPKPVQRPHPPLWIGASGEKRMLPIVGRHADVWHSFGDPGSLRRKGTIVEEHAIKAGRDPAGILRSTALSLSEDWDSVRATAEQLREAGVTYVIASWPGEGQARVEEFVTEVMPALRAL